MNENVHQLAMELMAKEIYRLEKFLTEVENEFYKIQKCKNCDVCNHLANKFLFKLKEIK